MAKKDALTKNETAVSKPKTDFDYAVEVSDIIELENIRQLSGSFDIKILDSAGEKTFTVVPNTKAKYDKNAKKILIFVDFEVEAYLKKENKEMPLGSFKTAYFLVYSLKADEKITDRHLQNFAKYNGVFNAWPYLREFVQMSTARLALPPLVLPTFRYGTELVTPASKKTVKSKKTLNK